MIRQHMLLPVFKALDGSEGNNKPGLQLKQLPVTSLICQTKPS
ncbi:MAG: hypothetical protein OSA46_05830 [Schleiferiaceae bacterium]|nr:hypothetical protein [Schleiferiaceae bacterium]